MKVQITSRPGFKVLSHAHALSNIFVVSADQENIFMLVEFCTSSKTSVWLVVVVVVIFLAYCATTTPIVH